MERIKRIGRSWFDFKMLIVWICLVNPSSFCDVNTFSLQRLCLIFLHVDMHHRIFICIYFSNCTLESEKTAIGKIRALRIRLINFKIYLVSSIHYYFKTSFCEYSDCNLFIFLFSKVIFQLARRTLEQLRHLPVRERFSCHVWLRQAQFHYFSTLNEVGLESTFHWLNQEQLLARLRWQFQA